MCGHALNALAMKQQCEDGTMRKWARRVKRAKIFGRLKSWYEGDLKFKRK